MKKGTKESEEDNKNKGKEEKSKQGGLDVALHNCGVQKVLA